MNASIRSVVRATSTTSLGPVGRQDTKGLVVSRPTLTIGRRLRLLLVLGTALVSLLGLTTTSAQSAGSVDSLDLNIFGPAVQATAQQLDGKVIIAGNFSYVLSATRNHIARLQSEGDLDYGFYPQANDEVDCVAIQSDGKILIGGTFTALQPNGAESPTTRSHLARLNPDGSIDASFDPAADGTVLSLLLQADGKIIVAGAFTSLQPNGAATPTTRRYVARLNADGSIDPSFDPSPNHWVYTVAQQPDGKYLLGGSFTALQPNGAASAISRRYLARVDALGNLDASFAPEPDNLVSTLALQPDGRIVLGGGFTTLQPNGAAAPIDRSNIARVYTDGTLDLGFDPKGDNMLFSIALQANGQIVLGGYFSTLQPNGAASTTVRGRLARLYADGSLDPDFDPNANTQVSSVALQTDGKMVVGGSFTSLQPQGVGSPITRNRFARLDTDASIQSITIPDSTRVQWHRSCAAPEVSQVIFDLSTDGGYNWSPLGQGTRVGRTSSWQITALSLPASGRVRARGLVTSGIYNGSSGWISQAEDFGPAGSLALSYYPWVSGQGAGVIGLAVQPDGKLIIGGRFTNAGSLPRRNIARFNVDGSIDRDFDPTANNDIWGIAVQPDGKILLCGFFTTLQPNGAITATERRCIARLNPDGTVDDTFDPKADNAAYSVAVQPDGKILVGGDFTSLQPNGAAAPIARSRFARLNADGTLDLSFDPQPSGNVMAIAVQPDGQIVLAGGFSSLQPAGDPSPTPRSWLARVTGGGAVDPGFDPSPNYDVRALGLQPDGKIVIGGFFTTLQPNGAPAPISRSRFARLNPDGSLDDTFTIGGPTHGIMSMALQANGEIIVGGPFVAWQPTADADSITRSHLARLHADGSLDLAFDPQADSEVFGLALQADGKVLVGGMFTNIQGTSRSLLARLNNDAAPQSLSALDATEVQWQRSGASPEVTDVTFEQSTNAGSTWTLLGHGTRIGSTSHWELTGLALPSSGLIRARGRTISCYNTGGSGLVESIAAFPAPGVITLAADILGSTTATLHATVTSNGSATDTWFQYSTDPALATAVTTTVTQTLPASAISAPISQTIQGLAAHTLYYFRATTANSVGSLDGSIRSFTTGNTPPLAPDGTATVKTGSSATITLPFATSDPDGDTVSLTVTTPDSHLTVDSVSGRDVTFTPAAPYVGLATLGYSVSDAHGGTASGTITINVRPLAATSTALLRTLDTLPGAGLPGGPPADAKAASFGIPATDDLGTITFLAKWSSALEGRGSGLFTETHCLARIGAAAPTLSGATFKTLSDPVAGGGHVAFIATLAGVPRTQASAVFSGLPSAPALIAQSGTPAPGANGLPLPGNVLFRTFRAVAVDGPSVAILAQLSGGAEAARVTTANDDGIWLKDATHPVTLVLREGQVIGGRTIKTLVAFKAGSGSPGQGRGWLVQAPSTGPEALALVTFSDRTQSVLRASLTGVTVHSQSGPGGTGGPAVTGASFASYSLPATNSAGQSAFLGTLSVIPGGPTKANARGVFAHLTGTLYTPVARLGDVVSSGGATISLLKDPVFAADGGLAFPATLKGGGFRGLTTTTLFWLRPGESLDLLAQGGAGNRPVPDLPDAQFRAFTSLAIAAHRGPIFTATLVPGKGGVTAATASGVWAFDFTHTPSLLFRVGDTIAGRQLKSFTLLKATVGSVGVTRSFNDAGRIVWLATFTDRTTAIVITEVP